MNPTLGPIYPSAKSLNWPPLYINMHRVQQYWLGKLSNLNCRIITWTFRENTPVLPKCEQITSCPHIRQPLSTYSDDGNSLSSHPFYSTPFSLRLELLARTCGEYLQGPGDVEGIPWLQKFTYFHLRIHDLVILQYKTVKMLLTKLYYSRTVYHQAKKCEHAPPPSEPQIFQHFVHVPFHWCYIVLWKL